MLTYVADVFWHALVVPPFYLADKIRYNGGSFFVKWESFLTVGNYKISASQFI